MGIIAAFTIITIIVVVIIVFKDKFAKLFDGFLNLFSLGGILTGDRVPRDSVVADCPDTYTNNGLNCGRSASNYEIEDGSGVLFTCPPGYTNTGSYCGKGPDDIYHPHKVASCPNGYYNNGTQCITRTVSRGVGSNGSAGFWHWNRGDQEQRCKEVEGVNECVRSGDYWYPTCSEIARINNFKDPEKWTADGCCLCSSQDFSLSMNDYSVCENDYFRGGPANAYCYYKCSEKYGSNYTNNGDYCRAEASTMSFSNAFENKSNYKNEDGSEYKPCPDKFFHSDIVTSRCYPECKPNYYNNGTTCWMDSSVLNGGVDDMLCKDPLYPHKIGPRCYGECADGFEPDMTGIFCVKSEEDSSEEFKSSIIDTFSPL